MSKTVKELKSDISILKKRLCIPHKNLRKDQLQNYLKLLENSHNIGRPAYPTSKPPPIPKATIKIKIKKIPKKRKIKKIIKI